MKVVLSLAAVLALAVGFSLTAFDRANAQCIGSPCGAVLVPAPNPIPLRRLVVVPAPLPAPVGQAVSVPLPRTPVRHAAKGAAVAPPSSIFRSASMPIGRSPATPPAFPDRGIANGGETAGTIPSGGHVC